MKKEPVYLTMNQIAVHFGRRPETMRKIARTRRIAHDATIAGIRVWSADRIAELAPGPPGWWRKGRR